VIIKKVEIKENNAKIVLDNDDYFVITLETYLNNKILVGDEIEETAIEFLKNQDSLSVAKRYLLNKISRKKLSKKECIDILEEFQLSHESVMKLVDEFEKNYLINDLELAEFIVDYALSNKKGIIKIKEKLKERNVSINCDDFLNMYLDREKYEINISCLLDKYTKMGAKKSQKELKNYICMKMISHGYTYDEFMPLVDSCLVDEKVGIEKEIKKYFKKEDMNNENIAKITKKLLSKGFKYDIIKEVIRECEEDETY